MSITSIVRTIAPVALTILLAAPALASAQTTIYSGPNGFSYSNGNFGIAWGNGANGAFACGATTICQVASTILYIINFVLVPVLFAIAFIVFLYGIFLKYIWSHGDPAKVSEGHKLLLWGLIGFVIMISVWGLVNVVANTFGLGGYYAPPTPRSF